ncbi:MAG: hypothetical protein JXR77_18365 [Lentisphaeria bacterium]|nr:hypothetical protein [Lentisphaeria bacterium]
MRPAASNALVTLAIVCVSTLGAAEISFGNRRFEVLLDAESGALLEARAVNRAGERVRLLGGPMAPVDIQVGGRWQAADAAKPPSSPATLSLGGGEGGIAGNVVVGPRDAVSDAGGGAGFRVLSHETVAREGFRTLRLTGAIPGWEAVMEYDLPEGDGGWLRRRVLWRRTAADAAAVTCVRFSAPGVCIGEPGDCVYTMPSFWPPEDVSFPDLRPGRRRSAHMSAAVPPAAVLWNPRADLGLCLGVFTEDDWSGTVVMEGNGRVDVHGEITLRDTLAAGGDLRLGDQVWVLTEGSAAAALGGVGRSWELAGFRPLERPEWTAGAALYSLWVGGSTGSGSTDLGGLVPFQRVLLPRLQRLGFDAVWLNPINQGSYGPTRHRDIEPGLGTLDDLAALCDDAHRRGMRIWLDLIPHGPREKSPDGEAILEAHPEWVSREADGALKYWWGCLCCDYANPGWQEEVADIATFYVRRCGVDGWRVDCAAGSPDNRRPCPGLRPSQSGPYGAAGLLRRTRERLLAVRPDGALLGETGSALQLGQCDFIYDWATQHAVLHGLPDMDPGAWAPHAMRWFERQQAALPAGAEFGLLRFLENHDQYRSVYRYGPGHERALLSVCSLVPGLAFVFHEQDLGFGPHLERLFRIRQQFDEFRRGRAFYPAVASEPAVFTVLRVAGPGFAVAAINLRGAPCGARLSVPLDALGMEDAAAVYGCTEVYEGTPLGQRGLGEWFPLAVSLPAYGTKVFLFRPGPPSASAAGSAAAVSPSPGPWTLALRGQDAVAENGLWRAVFRDGRILALDAARSGRGLLKAMAITEGRRKVWPGSRLDFAAVARATPVPGGTADAPEVRFTGRIERGPDIRLDWTTLYRLHRDGAIEAEITLAAGGVSGPVLGELGLELAFDEARHWRVHTLEGTLEDTFEAMYPGGDGMTGQRYWHRSGFLWEGALFPPDPRRETLEVETAAGWIAAELPPLLEGLENAYLRERSASGPAGLALTLAWLDGKGTAPVDAPLRTRFVLRPGSRPDANRGPPRRGAWSLHADGSRYRIEGARRTLALARGCGGGLLSLQQPGFGPIPLRSWVYSDRGIYGSVPNSTGEETPTQGSTRHDFEPNLALLAGDHGWVLRFSSFLRHSHWGWANVASPRVQVEQEYALDAGDAIQVRCRVRPMLIRSDAGAFLAQAVSVPGVRGWRVRGSGGEWAGEVSPERARGRVWQSAEHSAAAGIVVEMVCDDGQVLRFRALQGVPGALQNLFLHDSGREGVTLFAAFLDGQTTDIRPLWQEVVFEVELAAP